MPFTEGSPRPKNAGIKKGQKQKKTIAKEEARAEFELAHLKEWEKLMAKQVKDALNNPKAREYSINQIIGKPKETVEVQGIDFIWPNEKTS